MRIDHTRDTCAGSWHLSEDEVVCDACGRTYPATPENRMAAVHENYLGNLLRLATHDGTGLLDEEEP